MRYNYTIAKKVKYAQISGATKFIDNSGAIHDTYAEGRKLTHVNNITVTTSKGEEFTTVKARDFTLLDPRSTLDLITGALVEFCAFRPYEEGDEDLYLTDMENTVYELEYPVEKTVDIAGELKTFHRTTDLQVTAEGIVPELLIDITISQKMQIDEQGEDIVTLNDMDSMLMVALDEGTSVLSEADTALTDMDNTLMIAISELYTIIEELMDK